MDVLTEDLVREKLVDVIDPELRMSIMELGLVYDVDIDDGVVPVLHQSTGLRSLNSSRYIAGTNNSVMTVANSSPKMIPIAMGFHMSPPPSHKGTRPSDVVSVVNRMGLNRLRLADTIASRTA